MTITSTIAILAHNAPDDAAAVAAAAGEDEDTAEQHYHHRAAVAVHQQCADFVCAKTPSW